MAESFSATVEPIGFAAALLAAAVLGAALLALRDAFIRRRELRDIVRALLGEVVVLRSQAAQIAEQLAARRSAHGQGAPTRTPASAARLRLSEPMIYRALAGRLGVLPRDPARRLAEFYDAITLAQSQLAMGPAAPEADDAAYLLLSRLVRAVCDVEPALRWAERLLGRRPAEDPEVGAASELLEQIEEGLTEDAPGLLAPIYTWPI